MLYAYLSHIGVEQVQTPRPFDVASPSSEHSPPADTRTPEKISPRPLSPAPTRSVSTDGTFVRIPAPMKTAAAVYSRRVSDPFADSVDTKSIITSVERNEKDAAISTQSLMSTSTQLPPSDSTRRAVLDVDLVEFTSSPFHPPPQYTEQAPTSTEILSASRADADATSRMRRARSWFG
jgi:hypothetical protein